MDGDYDRLIGMIYEAAMKPPIWDEVIREICRQVSARYGSVFTPFSSAIGLEPIWHTNAAPHLVTQLATIMAQADFHDPMLDALWRRLPVKSLSYSITDLVPQATYDSWPPYRDFYRPIGIEECVGVLVDAEDHRACTVNLYFPEVSQAEINEAKRFLEGLGEHFARSARITWHLSAARQNTERAQLTLDLFHMGVAWLDSDGKCLFRNSELERLVRLNDGISVAKDGQLRLTRQKDLLDAIGKAESGGGETLFLSSRPKTGHDFQVRIVPLPVRAGALKFPNAAAILFISDETPPLRGRIERASKLFGFTPAEGEVVHRIMRGLDAEGIAAESGTRVATVRAHIKSILAKSGVSRQADLIRKVAFLP